MTKINDVDKLEQATELLAPAINLWGSEKDRAWADALLKVVAKKHSTRIQQEEDQVRIAQAKSAKALLNANLTPNGFPRAVIDADQAIDAALREHDSRKAEQLLINAKLHDLTKKLN